MLSIMQFTGCFSAAMVMALLSPSLHPFPPAEAIRPLPPSFRRAPPFRNANTCQSPASRNVCDPNLIHIAITLDSDYLRGSIAAVHSILRHASCPDNIFLHFLVADATFHRLIQSTFPGLQFKAYHFDSDRVRGLISSSIRQALEQPLNFARNYLSDILPRCVRRVIYLDSDLVVVDDIGKLWLTDLRASTVGAPEYCHANFSNYFTARFWSDPGFAGVFAGRRPCYFNTGVMVMDLERWRRFGYTRRIERWMEVQRGAAGDGGGRIYELGSLPPYLLVFAGHVAPIDHRWNQHGLGGDNVRGSCRDLHPGPVSLLHWSGSGKPWVRIQSDRPCPLDALWAPYDLFGSSA